MRSGGSFSPVQNLWLIAQIAAVVITIFGFAPKEWVIAVFRGTETPGGLAFFSGVDFRYIAVALGVALFAASTLIRNHGRGKTLAAAQPIPVTEHDGLAADAGKPSIAVLPFVNMSEDKSQEFFADGMTEDIITGLSCDSRLFVIARNSTFAYKGQSPDIRTVGKELGVRYVLEGSIRPVKDRLRITVQLIETSSGNHVWADRIDRPAAEIFDVMDEVVDDIVMALCANLGVAESNRASRQRPEDLQAWALCTQAERLFLSQVDIKSVLEAEQLARRATEIEPGYAVSWALLGVLSCQRIAWGLSADLVKDSEASMSLVRQAQRLAPGDPVVLAYGGWVANWTGLAAQAVDYLERSLAINPNSSFARFAYGSALLANASPGEARTQLELFIRRSPKDLNVGLAHFYLAFCYLTVGEFQQAEQSAHECIKHLPGMAWGYLALAMSLGAQGRDAEAGQQILQLRQLDPNLTRQHFEVFWRHTIRNHGQAEMWIAQLHQAWRD